MIYLLEWWCSIVHSLYVQIARGYTLRSTNYKEYLYPELCVCEVWGIESQPHVGGCVLPLNMKSHFHVQYFPCPSRWSWTCMPCSGYPGEAMNWKTHSWLDQDFGRPRPARISTGCSHTARIMLPKPHGTQQKMPLHYTPMFNMVHVQKETLFLFNIQSLSFECALQVFDGLTICLIHWCWLTMWVCFEEDIEPFFGSSFIQWWFIGAQYLPGVNRIPRFIVWILAYDNGNF